QREPAALIDVLRAAQSEVEHYTRIEFGMIDRDIEVSAHAVNDMVHLVAELFDNATAFSPPNSTVLVEARRLGDSAILSVEDRGIGISREQLRDLNERLANPPMVDVAVSRMMGLVVVARLANRHGVSVELRQAQTERGTVADVGLPMGVLVLHGAAGRLHPGSTTFGGGGIQQQHQPPPQQRSPFAEPLALESGNGSYPTGRPFDPNPPMPHGGMLGTSGGRSVPAWSDLTGAPSNGFGNGSNGSYNGMNGGANGFRGPRGNEPMPPIPQSPSPQGFAGDGLPQRRSNEGQRPDSTDTGGFTIPRQLPASPEHQGRPPFIPPVSAPPVPPVSAPPVQSYPPYGSGRPVSSPPVSGPPIPASNPAPPAPPAWPPVAADHTGGIPVVPERLTASLDMTAEIPRLRGERFPTGAQPRITPQSAPPAQDRPRTVAERSAAAAAAAHEAAAQQAAAAQATAAQQIAAAQAAARQRQSDGNAQYADETMELPIFRELESAWFTTANAASIAPASTAPTPSAAPAPAPAAEPVSTANDLITTQRFSTAEPTARPVTVPQQATSPESPSTDRSWDVSRERDTASVGAASGASNGGNPWQTAADEGWQAARAASEIPVETTTTAGLPKRTPMAQLVPGGVDRGGNSVQRRTPEAVRGLLSAYHRGVQRGRQSTSPEETSGGQQSGKEHEA
ncbi:MAG: hypothetical protein QOH97_2091, partial [Actinoplanes sp.]|nr:hypothetical protein [Actinoplanes sp.]